MGYKSIPLRVSNFTNYYFKKTRYMELENKKTLVIKMCWEKTGIFKNTTYSRFTRKYKKGSWSPPKKQINKDITKDINETINRINEDKKYRNDNYNPSNRNRYYR